MRADGWDRERILGLPENEDQGYWQSQHLAMTHLLGNASFEPGQRLVDVGSNTCWASNIFARQGLEVIALDIATTQMQGLKTADWFIETGEVFFERMLSVMYDPALASESVDYVFCCEVLHHNDVTNLNRTLEELYRVLKPGRHAVRGERADALPADAQARPRGGGGRVRGQRARPLLPPVPARARAAPASRWRAHGRSPASGRRHGHERPRPRGPAISKVPGSR